MRIQELIRRIEHSVPWEWALDGDPVGFQLGDPEREVQRVLVGLEVSSSLLQQATKLQADFLLVHHPLIYRPLNQLVESNPVQRLVRELIRQDIALYASHTNFDLHPEGMARLWAQKLGCQTMHCLAPKPQAAQIKLVTFAPPEHVSAIREALSKAGAGNIGEYDQCSFTTAGQGSFRGSEHTNPFLGQSGILEFASEERMEMVLPRHKMFSVLQALYKTHPYEEPAYDVYPLADVRDLKQALWIGQWGQALTWKAWEECIYKSLPGLPAISVVRPDKKRKIKRVALSTGSGTSFIPLVATLEVDAYLTGEVGYHALWEAEERGLNVVTVGHDWSESLFAEAMIPIMKKHCQEVTWIAEKGKRP